VEDGAEGDILYPRERMLEEEGAEGNILNPRERK